MLNFRCGLCEEADMEYESFYNCPWLGSLGNSERHPSTTALVISIQGGSAWRKGPWSERSRIGILISTLSCNTSAYSVGDMSTHLPPILLIKGLAILTFLRGPGHYSVLSSVPPPSEEKKWVLLNRVLLKTQLFSSSWWKFSSLTVCPWFYLLIRFGNCLFSILNTWSSY